MQSWLCQIVTAGQDVFDSVKAAVIWSRLNIQQMTQQRIQVNRLKWLSFVTFLERWAVSYEYRAHT